MQGSSRQTSMAAVPTMIVAKKKTKSVVWEYFGLECDADGSIRTNEVAICNLCNRRTSAKGSNTSNLFTHLGVHHPEVYAKISSKKLPGYGSPKGKSRQYEPGVLVSGSRKKRKTSSKDRASSSTSEPKAVYPNESGKHYKLTDLINFFLAKEMVPVDLIDSSSFRGFLQAFDWRYELPEGNHFKNTTLPGLYEKLRVKIAAEVASMSFFSATIDLLPNAIGGSYLVFTVHFIDSDWELKNYCLVIMYVPPGQPIEATGDGLVSLLVPWNLPPEKLTCVVTEESDDLTKVLEYMGWPQLPCFGSRVHQSITSAIQTDLEASKAVQDCRSLIARISQNSDRKFNLFKIMAEMNLSDYALKVDASGHWQDTQRMISTILKLKPAITRLFGVDDPVLDCYPLLKGIDDALGPVMEIMDVLTSEYYVNLSSIKPLLHLLKTSVLAKKDEDHELAVALKEQILSGFVSNYEDYRCKIVLNIATHLDPRFKSLFSEEGEAASVSELIISEGVENFSAGTSDVVEPKLESDSTNVISDTTSKKKSLGKLLEEVKNASVVETPSAAPANILQKEFEAYLMAPKMYSDSNPLDWWKMQASSYPNMALLARKYLSICAIKAPSKNLFEQKNEQLLLHGMLQDPEEVNTALFLSRNLSINPPSVFNDIL